MPVGAHTWGRTSSNKFRSTAGRRRGGDGGGRTRCLLVAGEMPYLLSHIPMRSCSRWDSNPWCPRCKRGALTTGPREHDRCERMAGVEPAPATWEAAVLPLNHIRSDRRRPRARVDICCAVGACRPRGRSAWYGSPGSHAANGTWTRRQFRVIIERTAGIEPA